MQASKFRPHAHVGDLRGPLRCGVGVLLGAAEIILQFDLVVVGECLSDDV